METERHEIGMIGLGVMGRNMLLNMADHGFPVAGYDKDPGKVEALQKESAEHDIHSVANIKEFIGLLRRPRAIMMLVPAGPPVDSVIADLLPHLETGDLIIDAGAAKVNGDACVAYLGPGSAGHFVKMVHNEPRCQN